MQIFVSRDNELKTEPYTIKRYSLGRSFPRLHHLIWMPDGKTIIGWNQKDNAVMKIDISSAEPGKK